MYPICKICGYLDRSYGEWTPPTVDDVCIVELGHAYDELQRQMDQITAKLSKLRQIKELRQRLSALEKTS